jgi:hypothetical protein
MYLSKRLMVCIFVPCVCVRAATLLVLFDRIDVRLQTRKGQIGMEVLLANIVK